ncbi:MAG: peroxidase-related enzyme [Halopseudomonas sp.]
MSHSTQQDAPTALALQIPALEQLDESTQRYFKKCQEKLGMVPNVLRAYSQNPQQLESFSGFYNTLMFGESGLSTLECEMIAVVVSSVNHCYYCLTAHGAAVRQYSEDPILGEQMVMNYRAANLSQRHRAMLDFADKLTRLPDQIVETDRQALRDAGFSDADIWDIANITGFYNMTNRVASATEMAPNPEYHAQFRTAASESSNG